MACGAVVLCWCCLQILTFGYPYGIACVRGHYPRAVRAEVAVVYLGAVGHARAFELLREEAAEECGEPLFNGFFIVCVFKGFLRQQVNFSW